MEGWLRNAKEVKGVRWESVSRNFLRLTLSCVLVYICGGVLYAGWNGSLKRRFVSLWFWSRLSSSEFSLFKKKKKRRKFFWVFTLCISTAVLMTGIYHISVWWRRFGRNLFGHGWLRKLLVFMLFHCAEEICRNVRGTPGLLKLSLCKVCVRVCVSHNAVASQQSWEKKKILKGPERDAPGWKWKRGKKKIYFFIYLVSICLPKLELCCHVNKWWFPNRFFFFLSLAASQIPSTRHC